MSRSARCVSFLMCLFFNLAGSGAAHAASHYLSWGQIANKGFAFVGKPDRFRNACISFMETNRIFQAKEVTVNREQIVYERMVPTTVVCQDLLSRGLDLGSNEKRVTVNAKIRRNDYSFNGKTSSIVAECGPVLKAASIVSLKQLEINGELVLFERSLIGDQICGEIAASATPIDRPWDVHIAGGSVNRQHFLFFAHREKFMADCTAFLAKHRIYQSRELQIGSEIKHYNPILEDAQICNAILGSATPVTDPNREFEVAGKLGVKDFWFTGKPDKLVNQCVSFLISEKIELVSKLTVNGILVDLPRGLKGPSICAVVFQHATLFEGRSEMVEAIGRIAKVPFGFITRADAFAQECAAFLKNNNIKIVRDIELNGMTVRPSEALQGAALCGFIRREARRFTGPFDVLNASGDIGQERFWFVGILDQAFAQCRDFMMSNRVLALNSLTVEGEVVTFQKPIQIFEACKQILMRARVADESSFMMMAGQVKDNGFAWFGWKADVMRDCETFMVTRGVESADKFISFDKVITRPVEFPSPKDICDEIEKSSLKFRILPNVEVDARIGSAVIKEAALGDSVMLTCESALIRASVGLVESMIVNGIEYRAPNKAWDGVEACGAMIRYALRL